VTRAGYYLRRMSDHTFSERFGIDRWKAYALRRRLGIGPFTGQERKVLAGVMAEYRGPLEVVALRDYVLSTYGRVSDRTLFRWLVRLRGTPGRCINKRFLTREVSMLHADQQGGQDGQAEVQVRQGEAHHGGAEEGHLPQVQAQAQVAQKGERHGEALQARQAEAPSRPARLPAQAAPVAVAAASSRGAP
jgi:hypothetical protein